MIDQCPPSTHHHTSTQPMNHNHSDEGAGAAMRRISTCLAELQGALGVVEQVRSFIFQSFNNQTRNSTRRDRRTTHHPHHHHSTPRAGRGRRASRRTRSLRPQSSCTTRCAGSRRCWTGPARRSCCRLKGPWSRCEPPRDETPTLPCGRFDPLREPSVYQHNTHIHTDYYRRRRPCCRPRS